MKIEQSTVAMAGRYSYYEKTTREEPLRFWVGKENPGLEGLGTVNRDVLELSDQALAMLERDNSIVGGTDNEEVLFELSEEDKQKIFLIQKLMQMLTGKKFKFRLPVKIKLDREPDNFGPAASGQTALGQQRQGWGLEYHLRETYLEHEQMSFGAAGVVRTADGREIDFTVSLSMSRTFAMQNSVDIRAGDAQLTDPLVLNFNGNAAQLTNTKFTFDLDADGTPDQVSFVGPGSGFLALDENGDGLINNGSELFGPSTGDGFAELARHDSDGNGWIDENDPIYDRLRIWVRGDDGSQRLFALGEKGVGAIFVGHLDTPFSLKNGANELQGQVRSTGVYLNEDGTPGTIQQVDLAV